MPSLAVASPVRQSLLITLVCAQVRLVRDTGDIDTASTFLDRMTKWLSTVHGPFEFHFGESVSRVILQSVGCDAITISQDTESSDDMVPIKMALRYEVREGAAKHVRMDLLALLTKFYRSKDAVIIESKLELNVMKLVSDGLTMGSAVPLPPPRRAQVREILGRLVQLLTVSSGKATESECVSGGLAHEPSGKAGSKAMSAEVRAPSKRAPGRCLR